MKVGNAILSIAFMAIIGVMAIFLIDPTALPPWLGFLGVGISSIIVAVFGGKPKVDTGKAKAEGEDAKAKVLADDPAVIVDGLDADTRARIDAAKREGAIAGLAAGLAALHGSSGDPGASGGNPSGTGQGGSAGRSGGGG